jgi:hypothetical protein
MPPPPPQYGQAPQFGQAPQYGQPYDQPPQGYEQTTPYGYPAEPAGYDQYGQPLPPPPGQPGAPWGQFGGPYYPPQQKSRTGLYLGLGVGAAVAVTVAAVLIISNRSTAHPAPAALAASASASATPNATPNATPSDSASPSASPSNTDATQATHTISLPDNVGSLHRLQNADTRQRIDDLKKQLSSNPVYKNPQVGFYGVGSNTSFSVWMLAEDSNDAPTLQLTVNALGPQSAAQQIAEAAKLSDIQNEDAGSLGGALLCGTLSSNSVDVYACEWVDNSSFGWVYFLPSIGHDQALVYTLDLRSATEK